MRTRHFQARESKSNHSLENLASKTKLTGLLKSTRLHPRRRSARLPARDQASPPVKVGSHHRASSRHRAGVQRQAAGEWWSQPGSNRRPSGCKPDALPAELWPPSIGENRRDDFRKTLHGYRGPRERPWARCAEVTLVGLGGVAPPTSPLSGVRSN